MDKTLLVLGAGADQIPGIIKAKQMGLRTLVLDGNPDAPGKNHADAFYTVSIKHVDQVRAFVHRQLTEKVDGVIAFGVDIPSIIAKTADMLEVNYTIPLDSALLSENKLLSKNMMQDHVKIPPYQKIQGEQDMIRFIQKEQSPIVIKPVDNSAARGISIVSDRRQIEPAIQIARENSPSRTIMAEKFLTGPQISTESLVVKGNIHHVGFADRNYQGMERFYPNIIENGGDLPSIHITEQHKQDLTQYYKYICSELNIENGVIKGDIVIHDNELYVIEFALRLSGGHFSSLEIPESTGVDFLEAAIKLHINEPIDPDSLNFTKNENICLRYAFMEDFSKGIIQDIHIPVYKDKNLLFHNIYVQPNDTITGKTTNHALRVACAIAKGLDRQQAVENAQKFLQGIRITTN